MTPPILLVSISGQDRFGITNSVTSILSEYGFTILDIGQAVIHDSLSLGLLVQAASAETTGNAIADITFKMQEWNIDVRFKPITLEKYQEWVQQQGTQRHIITLLARKITATHIAGVTKVTAEQSLNIDNITRLSGRISLEAQPEATDKSCIQFSLRGAVADPVALRNRLMELSAELQVDIAFQADDMYRRTRRLVAFDMDSTLINAEVIDELAREAGVVEQVSAITERAMNGELDFNQSLIERVGFLKGLDEGALLRVAERLQLNEGAEHLMKVLKRLGYKTAIISGGFDFFGCYLQQKLGMDYVYANKLEIVDGKLTGRVLGEIVNAQKKAELLQTIAQKEQIHLEQTIAVGDGANDLLMLSKAGLGIAFRAKPVVRAAAEQSLSQLGLDAIVYLMGLSDRVIRLEN